MNIIVPLASLAKYVIERNCEDTVYLEQGRGTKEAVTQQAESHKKDHSACEKSELEFTRSIASQFELL